LDGID